MKEYIEREAAIEAATDAVDEWDGGFNPHRAAQIRDGINCIPTADVRPVVRGKYARDGHHIICLECGEYWCEVGREGDLFPRNFCPNCGADMREANDGI